MNHLHSTEISLLVESYLVLEVEVSQHCTAPLSRNMKNNTLHPSPSTIVSSDLICALAALDAGSRLLCTPI